MPKVSVIAPVYNSAAYLREMIESVLNQTFQDFELILVNDGSSDGSGEIVDEYAARDARIVAIHQENGGQSAARNAGLDVASGDYVYIADSDDVLEPTLLAKTTPILDEGYELAVFGFKTFPKEDFLDAAHKETPKTEREIVLTTEEERFAFLTGSFRRRAIRWEPWNRVFRRDVIERWRVRFPANRVTYPEDMYFNYCYIAHISKILAIPDALYSYRKGLVNSVSESRVRTLMIRSSHFLVEELRRYYETCEDCRYLSERFAAFYFLLHKAALRRLRRYQWKHGLTLEQAVEILKEEIDDYPDFIRKMADAFELPVVKESYGKDRDLLLQFADRLYAAELLDARGSVLAKTWRRIMLKILRRVACVRYL